LSNSTRVKENLPSTIKRIFYGKVKELINRHLARMKVVFTIHCPPMVKQRIWDNLNLNMWMLFETYRRCFKLSILNKILALYISYCLFYFLPCHLYKELFFSSILYIHPLHFFCKACYAVVLLLYFLHLVTFYLSS